MHRRPSLATCLSVTTLLAACAATAPTGASRGLYTSSQAADGRQTYATYCAHCHAPGYFQGAFLDPWRGQSVQTLFDLVRLKMPEDRPDAMSHEEYVDVMAYIFALNDLPPGSIALNTEANRMDSVFIPHVIPPAR